MTKAASNEMQHRKARLTVFLLLWTYSQIRAILYLFTCVLNKTNAMAPDDFRIGAIYVTLHSNCPSSELYTATAFSAMPFNNPLD